MVFFTTWRAGRVRLIESDLPRPAITLHRLFQSPIPRVDFLVNGALQCSDTKAPYSCSWKVPGAMNKTYQLQARAFDQAGNVGTASIQVTAR
jgi:hypothetical protein